MNRFRLSGEVSWSRAATSHRDIEGVWKNHLKPHLGSYVAEDLTTRHIDAYKLIRKGEQGSNRTITKEIHYFSGFLRWAEKQGHITRRQWTIERLPYSRPISVVLSLNEAVAFIRAVEDRYRGLFLLMFGLCMRFSSARLFRWESVDIPNRSLTIKQKGGRYNVLPLSAWLLQELS